MAASTLVRLPAAGVVARIEPVDAGARADRQARCAAAAMAAGAPVAPLVFPTPIALPGGHVTLWAWIDADAPVTPAALGQAARALHDATRRGEAGVPALDPFGILHERLTRAPLEAATRARLLARVAELAPAWDRVAADDPAGRALVHGDLHRGNALGKRGRALLIDLELAGFGPASFDLAPALVAVERYGGLAAERDALLRGYGLDPRGWPGLATLVAVYELLVTSWVLAEASHQVEEAHKRVASLLGGPHRPWTLL
ncbi:MAG: phosphotransferase [bacterium]